MVKEHEQEEEIVEKMGLKKFTSKIPKRAMLKGFRDGGKQLQENFNIIHDDCRVLQHNDIEFGKYLDDIIDRLERIEKRLNEDTKNN